MSYAPVALFVYNRPNHTRQIIEALLSNPEAPETLLHIFSDAAKSTVESNAVKEVRAYIASIKGFKTVTIIERETNFGLSLIHI